MDLRKNKEKIVNIYSITDWNYHKGKVNWDDFFDEKGKFFLTIATMEMAKEDGFLPEDVGEDKESFPKRIFIQEKDKSWTVYEDIKYFTPKKVQNLLNDLGKLIGKKFIFKYKVIPKWWKHRLVEMEKN
ncbi:MAG: hypothetical protein CO077_01470 [Candidatus Nealsonbacteria bacterium CG_4_9_14_0_8_um_filter_35_12]|uniref:Uncharacterized protein n=1 Tax=Candidatus Nealsonbacteria bacterium CG_4_9_14_0_8_um_filter_35_12 TaxID=1974692 RepID=A0A2M8DN33_9BACT|nr:MAG: hypothetical protein CO077_01470 [Candidatus Nealsonbacteria bacterium CG_4_9_14_0_8_um_filter_35_12]